MMSRNFRRIFKYNLFAIFMLLMYQCKKDGEISSTQKSTIQNQDSIVELRKRKEEDSLQKIKDLISFEPLVFPKDKKDSVMAKFLEMYTEEQRYKILALNRLDTKNKWRADTLAIPKNPDGDWMVFSPFPRTLDGLKSIKKMAFFSYAVHAYGLYENGVLVKWGPSSMGKKSSPTLKGLMFTNWKKEISTSTVNSSWKLRWNFNIHNSEGIGWHQYDLPGFHASHACLRLLEDDAYWLYTWADTWVLKDQGRSVEAKGTPVMVFGESNFKDKPWLMLLNDPKANDISETEIMEVVSPVYNRVLSEQTNSEQVRKRILDEKSSKAKDL